MWTEGGKGAVAMVEAGGRAKWRWVGGEEGEVAGGVSEWKGCVVVSVGVESLMRAILSLSKVRCRCRKDMRTVGLDEILPGY